MSANRSTVSDVLNAESFQLIQRTVPQTERIKVTICIAIHLVDLLSSVFDCGLKIAVSLDLAQESSEWIGIPR